MKAERRRLAGWTGGAIAAVIARRNAGEAPAFRAYPPESAVSARTSFDLAQRAGARSGAHAMKAERRRLAGWTGGVIAAVIARRNAGEAPAIQPAKAPALRSYALRRLP